jgi:hypothetical protein
VLTLRFLGVLCRFASWRAIQFGVTHSMRQNGAPFCALADVIRSGIHSGLTTRRRQNGRIMSPKAGTPAGTTICKRWPHNELAIPSRIARRQNAKILVRQSPLSSFVREAHDKTESHDVAGANNVSPSSKPRGFAKATVVDVSRSEGSRRRRQSRRGDASGEERILER